MKKMILFAAMAIATMSVSAQEVKQENKQQITPEQRATNRANRLAKDMQLDEKKTAEFVSIYESYQKELNALKPAKKDDVSKAGEKKDGKKAECKDCQKKGEKKEFTDADAKAMMDKQMERQEARLERQMKALKIKKSYRTKFAKVLTDKQIMKVMNHKGQKKNFGKKAQKQGRQFGRQMKGQFGPQMGRGMQQGHQFGPQMQGRNQMRQMRGGQQGCPMMKGQCKGESCKDCQKGECKDCQKKGECKDCKKDCQQKSECKNCEKK